MTREIIPILSEAEWLATRAEDITSTMSPALFDMSPYLTSFELYHAKKSGVQVPFKETDRIQKGKRMEAYAAREVGEKLGMEVRPVDVYIRIPGERMGSSFDWEIRHPEKDWGSLEIKAVDYFQYKEKWTPDAAPDHIEVQHQHQMECADRWTWGMIVPFTGIYDFHIYERDRDREMGQAIRAAVRKFWSDVEAGNEPAPNFYRDGTVIDLLYREPGEVIDLTADLEFEALVSRWDVLKRSVAATEKEIDAAKAEIHRRLENATGAFTERYKITAGRTKDSPGKLITEADVGTYIGARSGYRQLLVKDLTEKKGN